MLGGYKPMVSAIQLIEIDGLKRRDRATKPMVYVVQTYRFKPPNIGGWGSQMANRLTHNTLETLRKYGRISEKIFCGREFLKINWVFSTKCFYKSLAPAGSQSVAVRKTVAGVMASASRFVSWWLQLTRCEAASAFAPFPFGRGWGEAPGPVLPYS